MRTHEVHATGPHGARLRKWAVLTAALAVPLLGVAWSNPASAFFPGGPTVDIVVTSTANPSTYDQSVTYTATLTTSDLGPLNMGDAIQFQDGGGDVPGCNSSGLAGTPTPGVYTATCQTSSATMTVGVHDITALFGGDATYNPGSGFLTQTVNQAATTTVITSPLPDASVSYGNESENSFNVTVSAPGVSDYSPSGSVNLYDGIPGPDTYLCTTGLGGGGGQSNGNCWIDSNQLNAGSYSLTAVYGGDSNFTGSSSSPQNFTVDQVTSQMQAFPIPGYAFYGAEKGNFFIAGVGGNGNGNPTGYVSIQVDGVNLVPPDSCPAGNGGNPCYIDSATVLPASTTPYEVTLSYPGDAELHPGVHDRPAHGVPGHDHHIVERLARHGSVRQRELRSHLGDGHVGDDGIADRLGRRPGRRQHGLHDQQPQPEWSQHGDGELRGAERHRPVIGHVLADRQLSR